jgi:lipopolysaccharide transport system ATP-binding protein
MSDTTIRVDNLGKMYRIGAAEKQSRNGWRALGDLAMSPFDYLRRMGRPPTEEETLWALRDVSFEVKRGEVVGIIGRNGAGKTTLLKILSRITEPTEGRAEIHGRVGSLLEVGTGFHPELTGRENIYLNGAILGMRKVEIDHKFDEIVDFSGIEKFIDTPVKRYSSGMYVRLAFAVAAHLEPEILLVDEVLAVGDVAFQKKCLGKMGDVAKAGRTVLLVSHNMASMTQLCPNCIWLDCGQIKQMGETSPIVRNYVATFDASGGSAESFFPELPDRESQVRKARLCNQRGETSRNYECDEPVILEFVWQVHRRIPGLYGYLSIQKPDSTPVMVSDSFDTPPNPLDDLAPGYYLVGIVIPARTLAPGDYLVYLNFTSDRAQQWNVHSPGVVGWFSLTDHGTRRGNARLGFFSTALRWDVNPWFPSNQTIVETDCLSWTPDGSLDQQQAAVGERNGN